MRFDFEIDFDCKIESFSDLIVSRKNRQKGLSFICKGECIYVCN